MPNQRIAKLKSFFSNGRGLYLLLVVSIYLLFFEEPVARTSILIPSLFRNLLPIGAVIFFIRDIPADGRSAAKYIFNPYVICALIFSFSGMTGYFLRHYQTFGITVRAMLGHLRFWLCLYFFIMLCRSFDVRRFAMRLFAHTAFLSALLCALSFVDFFAHIWPRQIYRWGIGSIQLFFGHPSNLGARAVFLIAMLLILKPMLPADTVRGRRLRCAAVILPCGLLLVMLMTLRFRLFGFAVFFVILYLYMIILKKPLGIPVVLAGLAGAALIGGRRLYNFYVSPFADTTARGRITSTSFLIARDRFPFGSGFGTFGSRLAQIYYSPLYYRYNMGTTVGLSPDHPNYACDTFFPSILAESGWVGLAAYLGLIIILLITIFRASKNAESQDSSYYVLAALALVIYELLESTGTLAFSETYAVLIALSLGLALALLMPPSSHRAVS